MFSHFISLEVLQHRIGLLNKTSVKGWDILLGAWQVKLLLLQPLAQANTADSDFQKASLILVAALQYLHSESSGKSCVQSSMLLFIHTAYCI